MGEVLSIRANSSTLPPGTDHRRSYTRAETR